MKSFLQEVAAAIYQTHRNSLENVTLIFPNRRAALYFRKHLAGLLDKPAFSPGLLTIEDFIGTFSKLRVPEKLQLIYKLYKVYQQVVPESAGETFDQFYFWGEMLLKDFDEIDKYMVDASLMFRDLSKQKELDTEFDFLTDEQREFLRSFWSHFDEKTSINKKRFLETWQSLPTVYQTFTDTLATEGLAYEGMLHRIVSSNIKDLSGNSVYDRQQRLIFAGFNALTKAEEGILTYFVEHRDAVVYWDVDNYYFHNQVQEAGKFFREYSDHRVLGKTFPSDIPSNFIRLKQASLYAAAQPVGQAKAMAQILAEKLQSGYVPEETLVVLPDEKLLTAVLHGIAGKVEKLNVTMGFPLASTPTHNLIELLIELQQHRRDDFFSHHQVLGLLGHPYVVAADPAVSQTKRKKILQDNWVHVPQSFLATHIELHRKIFIAPQVSEGRTYAYAVTAYLKSVVVEIGALNGLSDIDREYCFHFLQILNRMEEVFSDAPIAGDETRSARAVERAELKSFLRLFRQISRSEKIPFSGEPLRGLQVMGVLETRNLDFKNVFILSLNEGSFPSFSSGGSYVPYNIRQAYGMPTVENQDAMYAYLFYRVLQRAENVHLFYNSETDDLGQGEMSRYLQQLVYESGITFDKHVLHNDLQPLSPGPLSVAKDDRVFNALAQYCLGAQDLKPLTPTALNDYLECRLKFYFKYVAKIREPREVEEDLDARVLGNFLHMVMEYFYQEILDAKGVPTIEAADFIDYEKRIAKLIDRAFVKNYGLDPDRPVTYEGQRLVVREIIKRFVDRIIEIDKGYVPFSIEAIERKDISLHVNVDKAVVVLGGTIDRADRKSDVIRVIDYKTGKDDMSFADVPSLFLREKKRNKAAFQTFMYTLLFEQTLQGSERVRLVPGLFNRINIFNDDFRFGLIQGKSYLEDASPLLPEFRERIAGLVTEIFDPTLEFDQTPDTDACKICSYSHICYR